MNTIHIPINKKNIAYYVFKQAVHPIFYYPEGIYQDALKRSFEQTYSMLSHYSKISIVLLTIHHKEPCANNLLISMFLKKLMASLKQHYQCHKIAYCWAREQTHDCPHYHLAIILNGHKCQSSYYLFEQAKVIWQSISHDGFIFHNKRGIFLIKRNDKSGWTLRNALMRLSYAAKIRTKETIPRNVRKFGFSQIKPNPKFASITPIM